MQLKQRIQPITRIVTSLLTCLWATTCTAQRVVYSEGFNTDGNETRYELIRDDYELTRCDIPRGRLQP